jgi:hypothetical protein
VDWRSSRIPEQYTQRDVFARRWTLGRAVSDSESFALLLRWVSTHAPSGSVAPQWSKCGHRLSALFAITDEMAATFLANFLVIASLITAKK